MIPRSLSLLANEDLMITASSATGLITTPDAWQPSPALGKMEVETLAILSADFSRVRFSTWLPTVEPGVTVVVGPENRMLILGSSVAKDLSRTAGVDVPMISPLQETFGSGASDAFIALVEEK